MQIKRFTAEFPSGPVTERAREAGRRWRAEDEEAEREREEGR